MRFSIVVFLLCDWKVVHNFQAHVGGMIMVLWQPNLVVLEVVDANSRVIHLFITCKVTSRTFYSSLVYGLHSVVTGHHFGNLFETLGRNLNSPWLRFGDFISMLKDGERTGNARLSSDEVRDFLNCCVDLGLVDFKS